MPDRKLIPTGAARNQSGQKVGRSSQEFQSIGDGARASIWHVRVGVQPRWCLAGI